MEIILDNDKYIQKIIKNIKVYNNEQNKNFNFVPLNRIKEKKINEYGSITEGKLLNKRLNKINKMKNSKNRKLKIEVEKEIDLINNALNETMTQAFRELSEKRNSTGKYISYRQAAYRLGIEKIANTYIEMGLFP